MDLIIGGMASGKKEYVMREYGFDEAQIADGVLDSRPVLYNLQDIIRKNPDEGLSLLPELCGKKVVICNEVGSGIIPVLRDEVIWREMTGRICNELAKKADRVIRITCGIPAAIKGNL